MSRVQLALNVSDLDSSIEFYSELFNTRPHKLRAGYANFQIAEPPLKLVLIETADRGTGTAGALNHLGVEVGDTAQVAAATARLSDAGLATVAENATVCCHALQDKVWVNDPAGVPWEVYTITDDNPPAGELTGDSACCTDPALIQIGAPVT